MSGIRAIAGLTLKAALRNNVALFAVVAYAIILAGVVLLAPQSEHTDPQDDVPGVFNAERSETSGEAVRIRFVQSTSLGAGFFLAVIIVAVVGGVWLPRQIKEKQIITVLSKPAGAWRVVLGTWLGYAILTAILFAVFAALGIGLCRGMAALSSDPDSARRQLQALHTLNAKNFGKVALPAGTDSISPDAIDWKGIGESLDKSRNVFLDSTESAAVWVLKNTGGEVRGRVVFEIQKRSNWGIEFTNLEVRLWDPVSGALGEPVEISQVHGGRRVELPPLAIPDEVRGEEIGLVVRPLESGFDVVCYDRGILQQTGSSSFELNYLLAFALSLPAVLIFIAITVAASTFLSPNVSMFFASSIGVMGAVLSFIKDFMGYSKNGLGAAEAFGAGASGKLWLNPPAGDFAAWAGAIGRMVLKSLGEGVDIFFQYVLPDWSKFDASDFVLSRLFVEMSYYWTGLIYAGVYCAVCLVIGAMILRRREVGR